MNCVLSSFAGQGIVIRLVNLVKELKIFLIVRQQQDEFFTPWVSALFKSTSDSHISAVVTQVFMNNSLTILLHSRQ